MEPPNLNKSLLLAAAFVLVFAVGAGWGYAETFFTISPVKIELEASRGGVAEFGLSVINDNALQGQAFTVYVTDLEISRDGKAIFPAAGTSKWSAANWIVLEKTSINLPPLGREMVKGKLKVPRTLETGGARFAAIMVQALEPEPTGQVQTIIRKRAASFLYLTIRNSRQIFLTKVAELKSELVPAEGYNFSVTLSNEGNMHIATEGALSIVDANFRRYAQAPLTDKPRTIFPGGLRDFAASVKHRLPAGEYLARALFYYGRSRAYREVPFVVTAEMAGQTSALPLALTREPESIEVEVPKNSFRRQVLQYKSYEQLPVDLQVKVADDEKAGGAFSGVAWARPDPSEFTLRSGQARSISLVLQVPEDAAGERFAQVVATGRVADGAPSTWNVPVVIRVQGTMEAKGQMTGLEIIQPATESAPYTAKVAFKNQGNARLKLSGNLRILKREKFEEVTAVPFEDSVYPGEEKTVQVSLPVSLAAGDYVAAATVVGATVKEEASTSDQRGVEFSVAGVAPPEKVTQAEEVTHEEL